MVNEGPRSTNTFQTLEEGYENREICLCYAVLERAVIDAAGFMSDTTVSIRNSARSWIDNKKSYDPFSYVWICEHLNICPASTRKRIYKFLEESARESRKKYETKFGGHYYYHTITNFILADKSENGGYIYSEDFYKTTDTQAEINDLKKESA